MSIPKRYAVLFSLLINAAFLFTKLPSKNISIQSPWPSPKIEIKLIENQNNPKTKINNLEIPTQTSKQLSLSVLGVSRAKTLILSKEPSLDNNIRIYSLNWGNSVNIYKCKAL